MKRLLRSALCLAALPIFACDCDVASLGEYGPPGSIAGVVCDEATGFPVKERPVRFESDNAERQTSAMTDEWGAFRMEDVPAGPGKLLISVGGVGRSQSLEVIEGETVVFQDAACRPGVAVGGVGELEGTVCNRHVGDLVQDAEVSLALPDGEVLETTTDGAGFFRLQGVPAGERIVSITAAGYSRSFLVTVLADETAYLDEGGDCERLDGTNGLLSGAFCDPTYQGPLMGAELSATDSAGESYTGTTDVDGYFVLGPMAPGEAELRLSREPDVEDTLAVTVVAGEEVEVSASWSCGNGGGGGGGGGGPPGDVRGRVCAPDGETWLGGATVWIEVAGTRYETTTDGEGNWQLNDVPSGTHVLYIEKGSFSTTIEVEVVEGTTVTLPEEECQVGLDEMLIAVVDGSFDDVYTVLVNVGIEPGIIDNYDYGWAGTLLGNYDLLASYDIVFIECGADEGDFLSNAVYAANLKQYVQNGGSVYASDWGYDVVESMFASHIDFYGDDTFTDSAQVGDAMDSVTATVSDLSLSQAMGQSSLEIHYALSQWAVMQGVSPSVRVYLKGNARVYGSFTTETLYDVPHTVGFTYGQGSVIYTSFHQEPGLNVDAERLLKLLMFEL